MYKAELKNGTRHGFDRQARESIAECVLSEVDFNLHLNLSLTELSGIFYNLEDLSNPRNDCKNKARKYLDEKINKYALPKLPERKDSFKGFLHLSDDKIGMRIKGTELNVCKNVYAIRRLFSKLEIKLTAAN